MSWMIPWPARSKQLSSRRTSAPSSPRTGSLSRKDRGGRDLTGLLGGTSFGCFGLVSSHVDVAGGATEHLVCKGSNPFSRDFEN